MRATFAGAVLTLLLLVPAAATGATGGRYDAEIRRTQGGMPHIKARDFGSLGFGYAYAYAEDQACRFADIMATVNAQRSRYFGPDASYGDLGGQTNNLVSDFFYQRIKDSRVVERLRQRRHPHGPGKDVRATVRGFAAGWNAYLRRTGRDNLPDPRCRGAAWVKPIRPIDLYRRFYQLGLRASGAALLDAMVGAAPPGAAQPAVAAKVPDDSSALGSNGYAIGAAGARDAKALLLSNTHFPSGMDTRWYELHLTVPGKLNAIGAALQGVPVVNLGFNRHIAWTHTVSTARRFAAYELKLAPGDPTSYLVDGESVSMRAHTVRVGRSSHRFYETRWGPVVVRPDATLTWTAGTAYALADPNAGNFRITNQWAAWNRSDSVAEWRRRAARIQAIPGSTRSSPTTRATPTTATTASCRISSRRSWSGAAPPRARCCSARRESACSTARARIAGCRATATRPRAGSSARGRCRRPSGATTRSTRTTPSGCRTPPSG